jgi:hypothetical protein
MLAVIMLIFYAECCYAELFKLNVIMLTFTLSFYAE